MADPLGTLLQVVEIVGKAVEIYQKIQDAPAQIRRIGKRMSSLDRILGQLENLLRTDEKRSLARLGPAMTDHLLDVIQDIRKDSEEVRALFVKWDQDIGPWGMQFRFKFAAQAYFALGSSSDKLEALSTGIAEQREELMDLLQVMMSIGMNELLAGGQGPALVRQPSPSPSPEPPRADFSIIFVDPYNDARSIVAEAYTNLLREWTVRTGGKWKVKMAHSAGYFTRNHGDLSDTINGMNSVYPSYSLGIKDGKSPPKPISITALFDNLPFKYPYIQGVRKDIESRRSRGITKTIFKTYDYILVFTEREEHNMIRLRKLLADSKETDRATSMKRGKVRHLGRYLTADGARREIVDPKNDGARDLWSAKVEQIKAAIKAFLKVELRWKQPPPGAKVR